MKGLTNLGLSGILLLAGCQSQDQSKFETESNEAFKHASAAADVVIGAAKRDLDALNLKSTPSELGKGLGDAQKALDHARKEGATEFNIQELQREANRLSAAIDVKKLQEDCSQLEAQARQAGASLKDAQDKLSKDPTYQNLKKQLDRAIQSYQSSSAAPRPS